MLYPVLPGTNLVRRFYRETRMVLHVSSRVRTAGVRAAPASIHPGPTLSDFRNLQRPLLCFTRHPFVKLKLRRFFFFVYKIVFFRCVAVDY